jgi:hypothetical protein
MTYLSKQPCNATGLFRWISERHNIYLQRTQGNPAPWTEDPILQQYKFTNPFRENDRVTVWMRSNWTYPNRNRPREETLFNCCLFRMVGTTEFAEAHGWVQDFNPEATKQLIQERIDKGQRTFTGAYIITNQGLKLPKAIVVVDYFLKPIWEHRKKITEVATTTHSLEKTHNALSHYKGWGGGGFMAYEVVTDLNYTTVIPNPVDKNTWGNAGPGAIRGLNRAFARPVKNSLSKKQANHEMKTLRDMAVKSQHIGEKVPKNAIDLRCIEHSLCEWDKYERVRLGEGKPRSRFTVDAHGLRSGKPVWGTVN